MPVALDAIGMLEDREFLALVSKLRISPGDLHSLS
jgi:hypothetical protein